jgi:hypothetical protein
MTESPMSILFIAEEQSVRIYQSASFMLNIRQFIVNIFFSEKIFLK